ncbi:hypothetical protein RRG08_008042 [Elysia crispata]|uniref:Uncharacterized protein n=1 Tax=Elysia crispata TaxID=231223 RepID=A0AAE1AHU0_9GAST|nr:hypothetical protein RRG08_008042 [Elysia crispata]
MISVPLDQRHFINAGSKLRRVNDRSDMSDSDENTRHYPYVLACFRQFAMDIFRNEVILAKSCLPCPLEEPSRGDFQTTIRLPIQDAFAVPGRWPFHRG